MLLKAVDNARIAEEAVDRVHTQIVEDMANAAKSAAAKAAVFKAAAKREAVERALKVSKYEAADAMQGVKEWEEALPKQEAEERAQQLKAKVLAMVGRADRAQVRDANERAALLKAVAMRTMGDEGSSKFVPPANDPDNLPPKWLPNDYIVKSYDNTVRSGGYKKTKFNKKYKKKLKKANRESKNVEMFIKPKRRTKRITKRR